MENALRVAGLERLDTVSRISVAERAALRAFAATLGGESAPFARWLAMTRQEGALRLPDPLGGEPLACRGSVFAGQSNFLLFGAGPRCFAVVQYLHTADAVYLPARNLVVRMPHGKLKPEDVEALRARSGREWQGPDRPAPLRGVLTHAVSPYHFFYDCLPAFESAHASGVLLSLDMLTAVDGAHFLPLAAIFGGSIEVRPVPAAAFEARVAEGPGYWLPAGECFACRPGEEIRRLDDRIVAAARPARVSPLRALRRKARRGPGVWIGLCSRKRAWLNEVEALRALLAALAREYDAPELVFDGTTASLFRPSAPAHVAAERATLARIIEGLPRRVKVRELIGATSAEKITAAAEIDCFLSDYFTASMYPARLLGKPGLAWSSHAMFRACAGLHLHGRTRLLDPAAVQDEESARGRGKRSDHVRYRIDEAAFLREALQTVRAAVGEGAAGEFATGAGTP